MASYWAPVDPDYRPWQPILKVRYFFFVRMLLSLIFIAMSVVGMVLLATQMRSIPTVRTITPSDRVLWTNTEVFALTPEVVTPFLGDVLVALYTRNEEGRVVENLDPVVDKIILDVVDRPFVTKRASAFTISLAVLETKLRAAYRDSIVASFKTLVTSRTLSEYTATIVYFDTKWVKVDPSPENPLGWLMTGLVVSSENLFNRDEIIEEIRDRTALVGDVPIAESLQTEDVTNDGDPAAQGTGSKKDSETSIAVPVLGTE
jgi:hypothetical protein